MTHVDDRMAGARRVARWWACRATGVLQLGGNKVGCGLISDGGPVGPDGRALIRSALQGGDVSLSPCGVDGAGDRTWLATLLWGEARGATRASSIGARVPERNELSRVIPGLPLARETERCIDRLGGVAVDRLAAREQAALDVLGADLAALHWLGLIFLRDLPVSESVELEDPDTDKDGDIPSLTG